MPLLTKQILVTIFFHAFSFEGRSLFDFSPGHEQKDFSPSPFASAEPCWEGHTAYGRAQPSELTLLRDFFECS